MAVELSHDKTRDDPPRKPQGDAVFLAEHVKLIVLLYDLHAGIRLRDPWQVGIVLADIMFMASEQDRAREVFAAVGRQHTEDWICPHCREPQPKSFDYCWNCETLHPELAGESSVSIPASAVSA